MLVAGFVAGGTEDVDANQETVRLLRSQLRSKSSLRVIDADVMPLAEIAQNQSKSASDAEHAGRRASAGPAAGQTDAGPARPRRLPTPIKDEKDIEPYERLFANTAYWKQIGEEYQNPLIVTGTVLFMERTGVEHGAARQNERLDAFGRRRVDPGARLHGPQGLRAAAEVHLHRRPDRRDDLHRDAPRRSALQRRSRTCRRCPRTSS